MITIRTIIPVVSLLLLTSCNMIAGPEMDLEYPGDDYVAWVSKYITGGQQCVKNDSFVPPVTKDLLRSVHIAVYDSVEELLPVCAACSCPAYAARHYALIHIDQVEAAKKAGFDRIGSLHAPR